MADFKVGDVIDGTVTKLVNFGAFVRVRDGLEGLIHISELSHQRVAHPGDVVHEGQTLKLKIISLDSERHRLGLSLKQAEEAPARPAAPEPGQGAPSGPRPERRPRPERGYSMADAVQEPEGGIDNTLASAFAQVRQQLAEAEGDDAPESVAATDAVEEAAPAEGIAETTPEAVAEDPAEAPAAAEAIAEIVETVAADEAALETAASAEIEQLADAAAANDANVEPAAEAVAEIVETVAQAEAVEEATAAEAIAEIVETAAADEAAPVEAAAAPVEEADAAAGETRPEAPSRRPRATGRTEPSARAPRSRQRTAPRADPRRRPRPRPVGPPGGSFCLPSLHPLGAPDETMTDGDPTPDQRAPVAGRGRRASMAEGAHRGARQEGTGVRPDGSLRQVHGPRAQGPHPGAG